MSDDLTAPELESESELAFEGALRPRTLAEFVGQAKVRGQLQLLLTAARMQDRTADHILLAGPPGLGKTTLAMIVAQESAMQTLTVGLATMQSLVPSTNSMMAAAAISFLPSLVIFILCQRFIVQSIASSGIKG